MPDLARFLSGFLRDPHHIAAIALSSARLAAGPLAEAYAFLERNLVPNAGVVHNKT